MFRRSLGYAARVAGRATHASGGGSSNHAAALACATGLRGFTSFGASGAAASGSINWAAVGSLAAAGLGGSLVFAQHARASAEERSFIMIKPDGVHRGLIADILKRFEQKGYKLVGIKVLVPAKKLAESHYEEHAARPFFPKLVDFLSSGAVVAMVWEGKDVIKFGRTMIGATNPLASAPGTIRGDYGIDVGRNIIHGSDSAPSAQREIALWFKPEELAEYDPAAKPWIYE
uniref:nucleoside-diphosphate kinase n=1 Tax=Chlamydomonas euryale TaxID=1486919 RepID=A0A7R9YYY9_9CHLO|mmetsp:Transcript_36502/g.107815  ORF Transcript_36502/g.107815 Transcript_36502/m.107815 type:complete len:231 (+) Transcript_36502:102-794(+)